jgi:hypothetical protein
LAGLVLGLSAGSASATLLNSPMTFPLLSYDNGGTTTYDASTDIFRVDAFPIAIRLNAAAPPRFIRPNPPTAGEFFTIQIEVDDTGNLVGGNPAGPDLSIFGFVDLNGDGTNDAGGSLLIGEILDFGFQNNGTTDLYDFRFSVIGGALEGFFDDVIAVSLQSERSNFGDAWDVNFEGGAKGTLGNIPEPTTLVLFGAGVVGLGAIGRKRG